MEKNEPNPAQGAKARCAPTLSGIKILFVCGPPGSGKDTLADAITKPAQEGGLGVGTKLKFASTLDRILRALLPSISDSEWAWMREGGKNEPHWRFQGKTPRQALINTSEDWAKPLAGPDVFGRALRSQLVRPPFPEGFPAVIADSGFLQEAVPVLGLMGPEACLQVRLLRDGTSFEGDSRGWWSYPGLRTMTVQNSFRTAEEFRESVRFLFQGLDGARLPGRLHTLQTGEERGGEFPAWREEEED